LIGQEIVIVRRAAIADDADRKSDDENGNSLGPVSIYRSAMPGELDAS
jgi:hypothetical protein